MHAQGNQTEEQSAVPIFKGSRLNIEKSCLSDDSYCQFVKEYHQYSILDGYLHSFQIDHKYLLAQNPNIVSYTFFRLKHTALANGIIPAGRYAVTYDECYYGETTKAYERLFSYILKNHLTIIGNAYEDCQMDELVQKDPDKYLIRVSIQIE